MLGKGCILLRLIPVPSQWLRSVSGAADHRGALPLLSRPLQVTLHGWHIRRQQRFVLRRNKANARCARARRYVNVDII